MLRRAGSWLFIVVLLPAVLLLLLEGVLRLAAPRDLVLLKIDRALIDDRGGRFPYVSRAGYAGLVYQRPVRINAEHLRGPALRRDARRRLLLLGDSVLFGLGLAQEHSSAPVLGGLLADTVQVLNSATIGYSTAHELAWLRAFGDALRPDYVLVGYCLNDPIRSTLSFEILARRRAEGYWQGGATTVLFWLNAHSYLYRWSIRWYHALRARMGHSLYAALAGLYEGAAWEEHQQALRGIVAWCRARNIPLGLVVFPLRDQLEPAGGPRDAPQRRLRAFAAAHGVPLLDLRPVLDPSDYLFDDAIHLNAAGMRRSLQAVAPFFVQNLYQP